MFLNMWHKYGLIMGFPPTEKHGAFTLPDLCVCGLAEPNLVNRYPSVLGLSSIGKEQSFSTDCYMDQIL